MTDEQLRKAISAVFDHPVERDAIDPIGLPYKSSRWSRCKSLVFITLVSLGVYAAVWCAVN